LVDENTQLIASLAEARERLESVDREQSENELRVQQANETLRRELEEARRQLATLAESASAWEGELGARHQAVAAAEASLADAERRIADQAERLAATTTSVHALEQQLASAREMLTTFEQERNDWQQLAESATSTSDFEEQLAAARETLAVLKQERDEWQRRASAATRHEAEQSQQIAELESQIASLTEQLATRPVECPPQQAQYNWEPATVSEPSADYAEPDDSVATSWSSEQPVSETLRLADSLIRELEASKRVADEEPTSPSVEADEQQSSGFDVSGSADYWNASREPEPENAAPLDEPVSAAELPRESAQATPVERSDEAKPTSFIEKYSHMFEDDSSSPQSATPKPTPTTGMETAMPRSLSMSPPLPVPAQSAANEDEESIEQYMSKLLQRVRGQSGGPEEAQAKPADPLAKLAVGQAQITPGQPSPSVGPALAGASKFAWTPAPEGGRSKSTTPAPQTDLEALRALANETARRAISRHALRKHRRNAVTKVIVSTLAGVTSLWLILEAPSWKTLQFNTACVALMVAAYWAGQTFRALLQAFREKSLEETEEELGESAIPLNAPLPIDVEKPVSSIE
jgi:hypothetical protein